METIYLDKFNKLVEQGIAYIPVGTIEWHGNHAPIETDFMVAQKLCELLSNEIPGYVLPLFYLGGYGSAIVDGKEMRGMDRKLKKFLPGNLYFLKPELFKEVLGALIENLENQGFKKIIILTGHGGDGQLNTLKEVEQENSNVILIDPYTNVEIHHADEGETSILWACYPEEEAKSRAKNISADDDYIVYRGSDAREESSLELGKKHLQKMLDYSRDKINQFVKSEE